MIIHLNLNFIKYPPPKSLASLTILTSNTTIKDDPFKSFPLVLNRMKKRHKPVILIILESTDTILSQQIKVTFKVKFITTKTSEIKWLPIIASMGSTKRL